MVLHKGCSGRTAFLSIAYNGEIYNYAALRRELIASGHHFSGASDTEVLLHLWEEDGPASLERIRGMFAFAIWDEVKEELFLVRDTYGKKPLYYCESGDSIWFASEVKALTAAGLSDGVDDAAVASFFIFGHVAEPLTTSSNIRSVPAGNYLRIGPNGRRESVAYSSISEIIRESCDEPETGSIGSRQERLRHYLLESVNAHLIADVEVGVFLSSGIDSGTILALASECVGSLKAITLAFDEFIGTSNDEVPLAATIAELYGAEHLVHRVSRGDFLEDLPRFMARMDQPTIDGVNSWFVSSAAASAGLKVALSGTGGDELFRGYSTFKRVPQLHYAMKSASLIPGLPRLLPKWTAGQTKVLGRRINAKFPWVLQYSRHLPWTWLLQRALFLPEELSNILGPERAIAALQSLRWQNVVESAISPDPGSLNGRIGALESGLYMRNQLLRDTDWTSMAHSLEVRLPFVDRRLLAQVAPLSLTSCISGIRSRIGKKHLGATPAVPLPQEILHRSKTGFSTPLGSWIEDCSELGSWRRLPLLNQEGIGWARKWAYCVAEEFGLLR